VPAEIVRALVESADDIREGRIGDARDLLAPAEDRLRTLRERQAIAVSVADRESGIMDWIETVSLFDDDATD
jgi:hypothetical protein